MFRLADGRTPWSGLGVASLDEEIAALPESLRERLAARGFTREGLLALAAIAGKNRDERNRLKGSVEPPRPEDVLDAPDPEGPEAERLRRVGMEALARGEVALCVLAGGMATRMGGVVKALVDALPGHSFLDLRLRENAYLAQLSGQRVPLWLMTSEATDQALREALGDRLDADTLATFEQFVSLRLTPEGELFRNEDGEPSVYATGHGDLPDALRASGLLSRFIQRGGQL